MAQPPQPPENTTPRQEPPKGHLSERFPAARRPSEAVVSSSAFLRRLVVGVIAINLFVVVLTGFWLNHSRLQDQEDAATNTRNLTQILEQYIVGAVGKIDLALLTVADEHERLAAGGAIDARVLNELLARQQAHLPEVLSLRAADAGGTVKYGPGVAAGTPVNVADREYFIRARDDAQAGLIVTKPVFARISKKWAIVLARRLNRPDGSFAGVVYVNLALEHLSKTFSALDVGEHGIISLRDAGLGLVARYPELGEPGSAIGNKVVSKKLQELVNAGQTSGTYTAQAGTDGIERTFAFRRLSNLPYYIFVGLATEDYLAEWRNSAANALALIALFILTTLISAWLLYRALQRQMGTVEALAREETRFRAMADYTYDWEYWQGPNLEIIYMTPSCERITGHTQAEFMVDPGLLDSILHPDDRHLMAAHLSDATYQDEATLDFRIVRRDGEICWIAHGCRAVYREDGRFMGRRASNRDITERKQAEEGLRLLNETLDQRVKEEVAKNIDNERLLIQQSRLAAMGEMISNIAHQWRQPLNALALLLANLKDASDYQELDTKTIEDSTAQGQQLIQKMSTTIDDFRNFFKPNKLKEDFGLEKTIADTLNLLTHSLANHNIEVQVKNDHGIRVNGFPNEFSQVLLNVLNNAKDAMLERQVRAGKIEISLGQDEKTAWVVIRDNAGGIPDDILPKIFDPYFTTKEKGTGIGLYMSKMIMEHMNGTIEARNVGDGAEFLLGLPQGAPDT